MKKIEYRVNVNDEGGRFYAGGDFHKEAEAIQWAVDIVDKLKGIRDEDAHPIKAVITQIADDKAVASVTEDNLQIC